MIVYLILFLTGIIVGVMNAIAGGGTLVGFPVLIAVGLPPLTASATSFVGGLGGQLASTVGYHKYLRRVPKIYLVLLVPCALGAAIGAYLLRRTSFTEFEHLIPFLILLAVVLFLLQPMLHFHLMRHLRSRHKDAWKLILLGLAVLVMTIYGGYFGAGLGFALLALLGFTNLHEIHTMNAMKNVAGATIALVAIISISGAHLISWPHGLAIAGGNVIGGYAGARLAQKVSSHMIRIIVIVIGLATAAFLALRYH